MTAIEQALVGMSLVLRTTGGAPVQPADIYDPLARRCWAAALELEQDKKPVAAAALKARAELDGPQMEQVKAWGLDAIKGSSSTLDDLQALAVLVRDAAFDRRAKDEISEALHKLSGRDLVQEVLSRCQALEAASGSRGVVRMGEVIRRIYDQADEVFTQGGKPPIRGVPTGLRALDEKLTFGGWPMGRLSILAGKTSEGKSALASTCVRGAFRASAAVLCATLEDDASATVCRMLSAESGIDNRQLQRRVIDGQDWHAFMAAANSLGSAPVSFIEQAGSVEALCRDIRAHVLGEKTDLLVIDYLQLIRTTKGRTQQERTDHVLGEIVHLAHGLPETATLLVSQLKRVGDQRPTKEDLYHSGAIEQWAHTIGILWRPAVKVPGCVTLLLEKQKNGPTGRVTLGWDARTCSYSDPGPHEQREYEAAVEGLKR